MQNGTGSRKSHLNDVGGSYSDAEVTQRLRIPREGRPRSNSGGSVSLQSTPKHHKSSGKKRSHSHHRHERSRSADVRQQIVVKREVSLADDVKNEMKSIMNERFNNNMPQAPTEKTPLKTKPSYGCCGSCCRCCPIL